MNHDDVKLKLNGYSSHFRSIIMIISDKIDNHDTSHNATRHDLNHHESTSIDFIRLTNTFSHFLHDLQLSSSYKNRNISFPLVVNTQYTSSSSRCSLCKRGRIKYLGLYFSKAHSEKRARIKIQNDKTGFPL